MQTESHCVLGIEVNLPCLPIGLGLGNVLKDVTASLPRLSSLRIEVSP